MKKTNKIIIASIVVAVLLLGIGYAAITNVTLNIGGTLQSDPNQANFVVKFDGETTPTVSNEEKVTATITDNTNARFDVTGLETVGETVTALYTVVNDSDNLSADLSVATTNTNQEYFTVKAQLGKTSLTAKDTTTVLVTATLTKAPITDSESATVNVAITGYPVQPGEEGTSGFANGTSQSPEGNVESGNDPEEDVELMSATLASVTNANIGDYIDLGNNIVGTEETTDDWRIFYAEDTDLDGTTDKVYAILADYLPNSTGYAKTAGLTTTGLYGANSQKDRDDLVSILTTTSKCLSI